MPRPRLLHPVPVVIQPSDLAATDIRANAREPVKTVARASEVNTEAQIQWTRRRDPNNTRSGMKEDASGYLLFRKTDLAELEYTPTQGDQITAIGDLTGLSLYMTSQEPAGHYDGQHWLLLVNFTDKVPAR